MEFVLTGLDIEEKAAWLRAQLDGRIECRIGDLVDGPPRRLPTPRPRRARRCLLRCVVKDDDRRRGRQGVHGRGGRARAGVVPRLHADRPARRGVAVRRLPAGVRRPRRRRRTPCTCPTAAPRWSPDPPVARAARAGDQARTRAGPTRSRASPTTRSPGGCRSARSCTRAPATRAATPTSASGCAPGERATSAPQWLRQLRDRRPRPPPRPRGRRTSTIEVFALPNLHGVNVLVHGLLGDGVAASTRFDPQAKALGEWLRSRLVSIPEELL